MISGRLAGSVRLGGGSAGDVKVEIWLDWVGMVRGGAAAIGARRLRLDDCALWNCAR